MKGNRQANAKRGGNEDGELKKTADELAFDSAESRKDIRRNKLVEADADAILKSIEERPDTESVAQCEVEKGMIFGIAGAAPRIVKFTRGGEEGIQVFWSRSTPIPLA